MERTLAIIKPDAVAAKHTGNIIDIIENNDFNIVRMYKTKLTRDRAERFYAVHKGKPFFEELVSMMISGPIIVLALERDGAIKAWRDLMGDTNPANAAPGTIRNLYGTSIGSNATHGSDAPATAATELAFFFPDL
jgi:nucleoside-diphosphate kinase